MGKSLHRVAGGTQVPAPGHSPVLEVQPLQERGDDLAQLHEHHVGVGADLRQRVGSHPQEQVLVALAAAVDADVRERCGGQHPPHRVERLGADGLAVHEVRVPGSLRELAAEVLVHHGQRGAVGLEHGVEVGDVAGAEARTQDVGIPVVAVAAAEACVVGHIARGLLEVGHEPSPLQHLGEHVGGLLARQVHTAQLRHRVVAVLEEDPVVEFLGPAQTDRGVHAQVAADVELADEFVEEQAPQALVGPRVTGEQSPLHDFGQVDQGEYRLVEVREVATQDVGLGGRELLSDVHARCCHLPGANPQLDAATAPVPPVKSALTAVRTEGSLQ